MSDLIYEAVKALGDMNAQRHTEVILRLDHINGTIRRHEVELTDVTLKQKVCQEKCQACLNHLEPTVATLDEDVRVAKRFGKIFLAVVSALFTVGLALMGLR
jgi:hypothetical protein